MPFKNSDGTVAIERSEFNLARSQIIADKLDGKIMLDSKRLSGRDAVAEVARMLRGKDILAEDAKRRQKGAEQSLFAKELIKLAKVARNPKSINPETNKPYTLKEIQEILNGAKYMLLKVLIFKGLSTPRPQIGLFQELLKTSHEYLSLPIRIPPHCHSEKI